MPSRWDDKWNWEDWDNWSHLRANNPTRRGWRLLAAVLLAVAGGAAGGVLLALVMERNI